MVGVVAGAENTVMYAVAQVKRAIWNLSHQVMVCPMALLLDIGHVQAVAAVVPYPVIVVVEAVKEDAAHVTVIVGS